MLVKAIYTPAVVGSIPSAPTNIFAGHSFERDRIVSRRNPPVPRMCDRVVRRGTKNTAAQYLRCSVGNDDRLRTMHATAQQIDRELLPDMIRRLPRPRRPTPDLPSRRQG